MYEEQKPLYEAPVVTRVGSLGELTLDPPGKTTKGASDFQFGKAPFFHS